MSPNRYADDVAFLKKHTEVIQLCGTGDSLVAVAPKFQGRVMTSSLAGTKGASFGWLNRDFISAGAESVQFNNYGGEDRFWIGPEAGQFGLFFDPGEPMEFDCWKTPPGLNSSAFEVTSQGDGSVALATNFELVNYSGKTFGCAVWRKLSVLGPDDVARLLGVTVPEGVAMVGFESLNTLANGGEKAWQKRTGLLSIWIIGQFNPLPRGKVIVPLLRGSEADLGPAATTDYFGPLGEDRCRVLDDHLLFTCDGRYRSKIGIAPARAKRVLGSYDPDAKVLTIVQFNLPDGAAGLPYVNSLWEQQEKPFAGDVVNAYNDGETAPGAGQMGPFYELETSSPAAALKPGGSVTHTHRTFHFAGEVEALNVLSAAVLGVDLAEVG